jgi:hypothetical protein
MLLCGVVFPRLILRKLAAPVLGALGLTVCIVTTSACHHPSGGATQTAASPPAATSAATAPAPPPPPPKCEDLAENCAARPDTKLFVGDSGAWFTPPEGWHYARAAGGSIAVHPDGTAMMILAPSPDPDDIAPAVEAMVEGRGVKGLKVEKLKRRLKKPQQTLAAAEGSVDLWEVDKAKQGEALSLADKGSGTLLVLVGKPAPEHTLIGIGFVVESVAETEAPKIMKSVQTLRGTP